MTKKELEYLVDLQKNMIHDKDDQIEILEKRIADLENMVNGLKSCHNCQLKRNCDTDFSHRCSDWEIEKV